MKPNTSEVRDRFVVVTPNFNMAAYLAETIESVLANLREGDEYFVIDGGSTDGSVEVIKRYASRLTGWVSEKDKGYADAVNKGLVRSSAAYQCWINCGDLLLPGALDLARKRLGETGADMIFGDDFYVDEESRVVGFSRGYCRDLRAAMLYGGWTPLQDACFWRADLYCRTGGLDVTMRNAADYDLFARFAVGGRVCYEPQAFSAFRRHEGQRSIAHGITYQNEKAAVRRNLVGKNSDGILSRLLLRGYYVVAVRWRARVLHRWWDLPQLHGQEASKLSAGFYGPGTRK